MNRTRASIVAIAAGLLACSEPTPPPDYGPRVLTAQLVVLPLTAPVGGSMKITLTITHSGNDSTVFSVFEDDHSFDPSVENEAGTVVWTANSGRQLSPVRRRVVLRHGMVFTASVDWNLSDVAGSPLPPGSYRLESELDAIGLDAAFTRISTPITIKPPG